MTSLSAVIVVVGVITGLIFLVGYAIWYEWSMWTKARRRRARKAKFEEAVLQDVAFHREQRGADPWPVPRRQKSHGRP
jgi:hypothetical protein